MNYKTRIEEMSPNARRVFIERYARTDNNGNPIETVEDVFGRVADVASSVEDELGRSQWKDIFYDIMAGFYFIPNSPTFFGADTPLGNLSACFVLPLEDDMGSEENGIFATLRNAALIQQTGGGLGFSFSKLRHKGDLVNSSKGIASGPVSFMKVYDAAFNAINQGGVRRSANIGVLRVSHPDVEEFIRSKHTEDQINNFNISVAITDKFMRAVETGGLFDLTDNNGRVVDRVKAEDLLELIAQHAWNNGEPGMLFMDTINEMSPFKGFQDYEATNPCGEQPLLPYESCNLGAINLSNFVEGFGETAQVNWAFLAYVVTASTRFLDNIIDANKYVPSVPKLKESAQASRRIGLGIMGLADALIKLGYAYDSPEGRDVARQFIEFVRFHALRQSMNSAQIRGSFPLIKNSIYNDELFYFENPNNQLKLVEAMAATEFEIETPLLKEVELRRPNLNWDELIADVKKFGVRNVAQVTIAPTGTRATVADLMGYGCEPAFAFSYKRHVVQKKTSNETRYSMYYSPDILKEYFAHFGITDQFEIFKERIAQNEGRVRGVVGIHKDMQKIFATAMDIKPIDHILMQATLQPFIDSAISKTINMPSSATVEDVKKAYTMAWTLGCKGITVYVTGSRNKVVIETAYNEEEEGGIGKLCRFDENGQCIDCD